MSKLHELSGLGQSIWYDNIRRALIDSGELQTLLEAGVSGVTSNPAIFDKVIAGSMDYDTAIQSLAAGVVDPAAIYEALALEDIGRTADLLRPIFDQSGGVDGYVSLEVSPALAHDTVGTVAEAQRLFEALGRPNVMIKVPATRAGIPAIETLISQGVPVNVTLIFSQSHYEAAVDAYMTGLEMRAAQAGDVSQAASVASVFVSRVDTAVDSILAERDHPSLQGQIAIANARVIYGRFRQLFSGSRWQKLAALGARVQRPLWASTSVKNPMYRDTLYVDSLIGQDTVNTVPPATLAAWREHGLVASSLSPGLVQAQAQLDELAGLGIDLEAVTQALQDDGVAAFATAYQLLLASVAEKRDRLRDNWQEMRAELGEYQPAVAGALAEIKRDEIMRRIWEQDHTVWRPDPQEISNRLGWLHLPERMPASLGQLHTLTEAVRADGYEHVLLLGMGGSSLAPEVFYQTFAGSAGESAAGLELAVLDSTDPDRVRQYAEAFDPAKTLYIVATKSGGTVETLSFFKYFYNQTAAVVGPTAAGAHFVAITDPGSKLADLAQRYGFRHTFLNDPNIGGRYSALSFFGLVPAALVGVDVQRLLQRAQRAANNAQSCNCPVDGDNHGAQLGAILGELARAGRDKVTFVASPAIASFGDWVEQLIAESTGKDGQGIVPVVGEPLGDPGQYGQDRLFVHLRLGGESSADAGLAALSAAGHPLVTLSLRDSYDLGAQFLLWEVATAVAGYRLGIQPFDQPNVESAKVLARQMVSEYMDKGELPPGTSSPVTAAALQQFLAQAQAGDYVSFQAYVPTTAATDAALQALRTQVRDRYQLATTVGYGPRFLHSTGQLHKGDGGNGLFVQFTSDAVQDVDIPDEAGQSGSSMSFGVLKMAQALGDGQALRDNQRRVIRFHLGSDVVGGLQSLMS